jgi:hypothetical protein
MSDHWRQFFARLHERDLAALRIHAGEAYEITYGDGRYRATRRESGRVFTSASAAWLWELLTADQQSKPAPGWL